MYRKASIGEKVTMKTKVIGIIWMLALSAIAYGDVEPSEGDQEAPRSADEYSIDPIAKTDLDESNEKVTPTKTYALEETSDPTFYAEQSSTEEIKAKTRPIINTIKFHSTTPSSKLTTKPTPLEKPKSDASMDHAAKQITLLAVCLAIGCLFIY